MLRPCPNVRPDPGFAGSYTMPQIATAFGVSTKTVSRAVAAFEKAKSCG